MWLIAVLAPHSWPWQCDVTFTTPTFPTFPPISSPLPQGTGRQLPARGSASPMRSARPQKATQAITAQKEDPLSSPVCALPTRTSEEGNPGQTSTRAEPELPFSRGAFRSSVTGCRASGCAGQQVREAGKHQIPNSVFKASESKASADFSGRPRGKHNSFPLPPWLAGPAHWPA